MMLVERPQADTGPNCEARSDFEEQIEVLQDCHFSLSLLSLRGAALKYCQWSHIYNALGSGSHSRKALVIRIIVVLYALPLVHMH